MKNRYYFAMVLMCAVCVSGVGCKDKKSSSVKSDRTKTIKVAASKRSSRHILEEKVNELSREGTENIETHKTKNGGHDENSETVEVVIGEFQYPNRRATAGAATYVKFTLIAKIIYQQEIDFVRKVKKDHAAEVREAVEKVIRAAVASELEDPVHSVIAGKVREEINKVLKQDYIKRVIFNNWSAVVR